LVFSGLLNALNLVLPSTGANGQAQNLCLAAGNHVECARFRCRSGAPAACDEISGVIILLEIGIIRRCERSIVGIKRRQPATPSILLSCCLGGGGSTHQRQLRCWWHPVLQHDEPISFVG